ncbi:hypothetical protein ABZ208_00660 [Streptomyces sp. NPDC006208]|uniref:hypothetical protein n=1 Tax=Streptomyces sp. NPDC006208 TaxID=3156734 RepID=UPI00339E88E7
MTRMKKYVAAAAVVAAALAGAPTLAHAVGSGSGPATTSPSGSGPAAGKAAAPAAAAPASAAARPAPAAQASRPSSGVRVVTPGQRVQAAPGVELWLTEEGKHWSVPGDPDQFRSVVDGNLDMSTPGVSLQGEPVDGPRGPFYFLSGVFYGSRDAARVDVRTSKGRFTAEMVTLPGRPGWGAWYTTGPLPDASEGGLPGRDDFLRSVTLYDRAGKQLAQLDLR